MSEAKKPKLSSLRIGTHSGTFHADEALAVYLLRTLPHYADSQVVRSRDPAVLETCDIVVDVGGEYDPSRHRYDHHQRGFAETYSPAHRTKLSSAGLIYKHFGEDIVAQRLGLDKSDTTVSVLVAKLYDDFIEAIDGVDNGVTQYEAVGPQGQVIEDGTVTVVSRYRNVTSLSSRVGHLNPLWNEPSSSDILDEQFQKASTLAGCEFMNRLDYFSKAWLPGRSLVQSALEQRFDEQGPGQHLQGRVLIFDKFCPWKDHLHTLEREMSIDPTILFIVYPDETSSTSTSASTWRLQAVPVRPDAFESRRPLPQSWRGLRDEALCKETGVAGCIFAHASGFIAGAETKEAVLELAHQALHL